MKEFYNLNIKIVYCQYPNVVRMSLYFHEGKHTLKLFSEATAKHPDGTVVDTFQVDNIAEIMRILASILVDPVLNREATYQVPLKNKLDVTYTRPVALIIKDEKIKVGTWKGLVITAANWAYNNHLGILRQLKAEHPKWFPDERHVPNVNHISDSGYFVYAGVSAVDAVEFVKIVLCDTLEHEESDISIHIKDTEKAWEYRGNQPLELPKV